MKKEKKLYEIQQRQSARCLVVKVGLDVDNRSAQSQLKWWWAMLYVLYHRWRQFALYLHRRILATHPHLCLHRATPLDSIQFFFLPFVFISLSFRVNATLCCLIYWLSFWFWRSLDMFSPLFLECFERVLHKEWVRWSFFRTKTSLSISRRNTVEDTPKEYLKTFITLHSNLINKVADRVRSTMFRLRFCAKHL